MKNADPILSVVMSVYRPESEQLRIAVRSILDQSFRDFEFVILDDGNPQNIKFELEEISKWDKRIRLINLPENIGLTRALNIGIKSARGEYIARMDSDDFSFPNRFEMQIAYLRLHPETVLCGSDYFEWDGQTSLSGSRQSRECGSC